MYVVALVGKSGTGKSYKALTLAYEKDIEYIVDDGLLIHGNKILEGKSAKREKTSISAVKRALFLNDGHRNNVINTLKRYNPKSILIIGTSNKMVKIISENLGIDPIDEIVYIENIASTEEIEMAKNLRRIEGKHVIPVPTFEIKRDFSGYFIDRLKIFKRRKDNTLQISEKSVVRPTFSYMGKYIISGRVIKEIIRYSSSHVDGIDKLANIQVINRLDGIIIKIDAILIYGYQLRDVMIEVQRKVMKEVEGMTSLNILSIDVLAKSITVDITLEYNFSRQK